MQAIVSSGLHLGPRCKQAALAVILLVMSAFVLALYYGIDYPTLMYSYRQGSGPLTKADASAPLAGSATAEQPTVERQLPGGGKCACDDCDNSDDFSNLPVFYSDIHPDPLKFNMYFMETSSTSKIPPRVICAIESFCMTNPSGIVWFLVTSRSLNETTRDDLGTLRAIHPNLRVAYLEFELLLQATPLFSLYKSKNFWKTPFLPNNLSNIGRLAVVFKSGGFYSDLDVIALRPVHSLQNFIVVYDSSSINNAVFSFEPGHPMLFEVMTFIAKNYNGNNWGHNGPYAMTQTARNFKCIREESMKKSPEIKECSGGNKHELYKYKNYTNNTNGKKYSSNTPTNGNEVTNSSSSINTATCDWTLIAPSSFYPNLWDRSMELFMSSSKWNSSLPIHDVFPNSCGVHLSNRVTKDSEVEQGSVVHRLALNSCPHVLTRHPLL